MPGWVIGHAIEPSDRDFRVAQSIRSVPEFGIVWALVLLVVAQPLSVTAGDFEGALRQTISRHPALIGKQAEVRSRQSELEAVLGQRYPTLSVQASANDDSTQPASLSLRQPLWTFGRIEANVALAESELDAEEADLSGLRRELIDQTAAAYVKVRSAKERVTLALENVSALGQLLGQIERRSQAQLASRTDVALVQARLIQARNQLAQFEGDVVQAAEELLALTQVAVPASQGVASKWWELSSPEQLMDSVLQGSTTLRRKERLIEVAQARVEHERRASLPTVYFQADRYINQTTTKKGMVIGIGFESSFEGVGLVARARVDAALARLDAARQDLETTRSALQRQVSSLWSRRDQKNGLRLELRRSINVFEALLASYVRQYTAGSKSWLDLINLQRETYEQRLQLLAAEHDWLSDSVKLSALSCRLDDAVKDTN